MPVFYGGDTVAAERKGFYTSSDYWGLVDGDYKRFPTEAEYRQYMDERYPEEENEFDVIPA